MAGNRRGMVWGMLGGGALFLGATNLWVMGYGTSTTDSLAQLPAEYACLVLGTHKTVASGRKNLFYEYRMVAAAQVYQAGKCQKIVVSGAKPTPAYNEPEEMKHSLIALGVPESAIVCDGAGLRTLDSVLRFKRTFGQSSGIVISQAFHNARAIYLGAHHQLRLTGFNAQELAAHQALMTRIREVFSKARAVLDIWVFQSEAQDYGLPIAL